MSFLKKIFSIINSFTLKIKLLFGAFFILFLFSILYVFFIGFKHDISLIEVKRGDSVASIAYYLKENNVIFSTIVFRGVARIMGSGKYLVAGEFKINNYDSIYTILSKITDINSVYKRCITFKEGILSSDVIKIINNAEKLDGENIKSIPEGYILPETYCYSAGFKKQDLLVKMHEAQVDVLNRLWATRSPGLPYKNISDVIIMASMVEAETGVAYERETIASVFINRLKIRMRLQTDPTVSYGLGRDNSKGLTTKDLRTPTPYNTYIIYGMPPAPINNPGIDSIRASLQPATTDYLYFVASGNGGHKFSKNLIDHNQRVNEYRQVIKKAQ